ncbi:hypothetical protein CHU95_06405 [Niveispirillum lacus]|uniref:Uncharacterized protein n=1 Tax=Niveispirillum lacus TaxID=1981099 RepID=A0A255Z373_9PROT|nr:hypothetical protein [Niveispirillum lacus]OYQ35889.1 hypothetical protein CHU95_06405 [Niveispirillum lacus]
MTSRTLERSLSRIDRQRLSALGLVFTTALLLVMAGVAASSDKAERSRIASTGIDTATVKAEMLERALVVGGSTSEGHQRL